MPTEFLFATDLHFRRPAAYWLPDLQEDAYAAWRRIVGFCLEERLHLILGGDTFDSPYPAPRAISQIAADVSRLKETGLRCLFIDGNHDKVEPSWMTVCGAERLPPYPEDFFGVRIAGLSYAERPQQPPGEETDILVVHEEPQEAERLRDLYRAKLGLCGHNHIELVRSRTADGQQRDFVNPGPPCFYRLGEAAGNTVRVTMREDGPSFKLQPFPTRDVLCLDVFDLDSQRQAAQLFQVWIEKLAAATSRELIPVVYFRFRYEGPSQLEQAASGFRLWMEGLKESVARQFPDMPLVFKSTDLVGKGDAAEAVSVPEFSRDGLETELYTRLLAELGTEDPIPQLVDTVRGTEPADLGHKLEEQYERWIAAGESGAD